MRNMIRRFTPFQLVTMGFAAVILFGAVLLALPISSSAGVFTPFHKALFTSTSAVCVTGLAVLDTGSYWSLFGQFIILLLIQIGGLGVVTVTVSVTLLSGRRISLMQRTTMQDAIAAPRIGGIVRLTKFILKGTFLIELIGAVLLLPIFCRDYGIRGIWMSIFHSVSAFCNAGFDILGTAQNTFPSLMKYAGNPLVNIVIMLLIIIGGIGFLTWEDVCTNKFQFRRYRLQSKIILVTTAILILLPSVFFFLSSFRSLDMNERILASFFQAVTPRTAGFNTVDIGKMSEVAQTFIIILMLIGGSPSSTAGGVKTTTIAVLILNAFATFRSKDTVSAFNRRIDNHVIRDASTLLVLYVLLFFTGGIAISMYEGLPLEECLYESASAVGTVGLTLGITPHLHVVSQMILVALMYLGRVGGLTLIYAVFSSRNKSTARFPVENITVG